ncbi:MAG: hypothetical protein QME51_09180 [Planctomycetota bacterium]|nr:hypothetical protein [Planctomycetota bacterium]MDI6788530.1 hypothetical protein [Planctomycetota bacterium]
MKPEISQIIHSGSGLFGVDIFRKTALGKVLRGIRNQLWRLSIMEMAFRVGFFIVILSIVLILISKILGGDDLGIYLTLPLAGLLFGALRGIFLKPALRTIAMVVDNSCNLNNYLTSAYECSHNQTPNQIERTLIDDAQRKSGNISSGFSFRYNWRYPSLFLILAGVMFIVYLTPTEIYPQSPPLAETSYGKSNRSGKSDPDFIGVTISQGLSQIKQNNINSPTVKEFIEEIEYLLANIDEPTISALIIEKRNLFIQTVDTLSARPTGFGGNISPEESAELRMLLERIEILANKGIVSSVPGGSRKGGTTIHPVQRGGETISPPTTPLPPHGETADKIGQKIINMRLKTYEEASSNPHWPEEYNEIIKKYFSSD